MAATRDTAAAAALLALPLRWTDDGGGITRIGAALERGFVRGAAEGGRLLAEALGAEAGEARSFGGGWPVVHSRGLLFTPALPAPLAPGPNECRDAVYLREESRVWRESGGAAVPVLVVGGAGPAPGAPFDLLWFGDAERYLLRAGRMLVDDLFCELRLAPSPAAVRHLLVRSRRSDPAVLDGIELLDEGGAAPEITVRRPRRLTAEDRWRDPEHFLSCRADVATVAAAAGVVTAATAYGPTVIFAVDEREDGWRVAVVEGEYPYSALEMLAAGDLLELRGTIAPTVDPLAPGMRARLAFDLRSDLVALG